MWKSTAAVILVLTVWQTSDIGYAVLVGPNPSRGGAHMKRGSRSWKDIGTAVAFLFVNTFLLIQLLGTIDGQQRWMAFAQPYGLGDPCLTGPQCASTFCVQGVCCNDICSAPGQSCTLPGSIGTCTNQSPAPVMSPWALMLTIGILSLLAWRRLRVRDER
jgi:hypothetical protein